MQALAHSLRVNVSATTRGCCIEQLSWAPEENPLFHPLLKALALVKWQDDG